ncbi:MAG: type II toxin-antitoxin system RelE/ParE family toxin [Candidatus Acidiferrales bacterium]
MAWTVDFYEEEGGSAPVEVFLNGLPKPQRAKVVARIRLLQEQGVDLPFPYSSQVRGRLRELRARFAKERIRIFYFADSRRWFILVHGVLKRTEKLAESDIRIAEARVLRHEERLARRKP